MAAINSFGRLKATHPCFYKKQNRKEFFIMSQSYDEKIESVKEKISQLENQKKKLLTQQKEHDRKARTHRLIERGALLESLIDNAETLTNDEIKAILQTALQSRRPAENAQNIQPKSGGDSSLE